MDEVICYTAVPDGQAATVAFATGCGARILPADQYEPCKVAVVFGMVKWRWDTQPYPRSVIAGHGGPSTLTFRGAKSMLERDNRVHPGASVAKASLFRQHEGALILLECGYVRRDEYWSVGIGGLSNRAHFHNANSPWDRWEELSGRMTYVREIRYRDYVLIAGQVPWDVAVQDHDHVDWVRRQVRHLQSLGLKVRFRPNPYRQFDYGVDCEVSSASLADDLEGAAYVVTWNSELAIDAVLADVPVVVHDGGSMAYDMAINTTAPAELRPASRRQWAANLAYCQWTLAEMRAGKAWEHIRPGIPSFYFGQ